MYVCTYVCVRTYVCMCVYTYMCVCVSRYVFVCGPGSSVGIATDYGLEGPGSNPVR